MTAPAAPEATKVCARCKSAKPLAEFDLHNGTPRKNCRACVALGEAQKAARDKPVAAKPENWVAPKPGETPMKRCTACEVEKVWKAFPDGSDVCRACIAGEPTEPKPVAMPEATKRPAVYTPDLGAAIADQIAAGATLKAITARPDMPSKDVLARWRMEHDDLAAMLATARQARADARVDEIAELVEAVRSGRVDPQAGRVAIDGLRWLASKDAPTTYGDKMVADIKVTDNSPQRPDNERLLTLLRPFIGAVHVEPIDVEALPAPGGDEGGGT